MLINTLIVQFRNKITSREIPLLRGAVIDRVGPDCPMLFHNHTAEGLRYGYPMIQYKRIHGQAAIVCVAQGCDEIGTIFSHNNFYLHFDNGRDELFEIERVVPQRMHVQTWNDEFRYWLSDWLPLNPDNYHSYLRADGIATRVQLLEKILVGNILSTCKGLGITIDSEITCKILSLETPRKEYYKGVPMMLFSCEFKSNISLPDYIGLGKGASRGYGILAMNKDC